MVPQIATLHPTMSLPNGAGISKSVSAGARIWESMHPEVIQGGSHNGTEDMWRGLPFGTHCYFAVYPEIEHESKIEFFLDPELPPNEIGVLRDGYVVWESGISSELQFRMA